MTELPQRDRVPFRHVVKVWLFLLWVRFSGPDVVPASLLARRVRVPVANVRRVFVALEMLGRVRVVVIENPDEPENPFIAYRQPPIFPCDNDEVTL